MEGKAYEIELFGKKLKYSEGKLRDIKLHFFMDDLCELIRRQVGQLFDNAGDFNGFNAKIKLERKQYKKRVLQLAPERIYQRAYQINCRENIAETLLEKSGEMKSEVLRCLLVLPNVIQFFYARWMGKGDSFQLELENSMDTGIKEIGLLLEQEETEAA